MVKKRKRKPKRKVKPKRRVKRYAGKTEKEWRDWGEKFGKGIDRKGKEWERECKDWWFRSFGFVGPLVGSIFGIVCLAFGIFILNLINIPLGSTFISRVSNFLFTNLHLFFAVFLFWGYSDYFSKRYRKTYWMVLPITTSICITIVVWVSVWLLNLINVYVNSSLVASLSNFLYVNIWGIFIALLVLGYALIFIKRFVLYSFMGVKR